MSDISEQKRNWALVTVCAVLIIIGITLIVIAILNISTFGWWSAGIILTGTTVILASITSIVTNDPSWILLDLILPL